MPYNASGQSFVPLAPLPINMPTVTEGNPSYTGLTTAQCAANGNLTSKAVTSAGVLVEAATARTNGITVIVPTDQPQVTFGNQSPLTASLSPKAIVAIPLVVTFSDQVAGSGSIPSTNGFAVAPGNSLFVSPFNDPMYAITPAGVTATIYFIDS